MIQKIASTLTELSIDRQWIEPNKAQWCRYALEKKIGALFFITICLLVASLTATWTTLFPFILVFYIFRQRLGGWHSKNFCSCQIVSLSVVIVITFVVGPLLEQVNPYILYGADVILIGCTFLLSPIYPSSARFSQKIRDANMKRKNQLLLGLILLQLICLSLWGLSFLIYSLLGIAITDISVVLQYITVRRKDAYHETH